jgi:hypothetical protein
LGFAFGESLRPFGVHRLPHRWGDAMGKPKPLQIHLPGLQQGTARSAESPKGDGNALRYHCVSGGGGHLESLQLVSITAHI